MAFDLSLFGKKLVRLRNIRDLTIDGLSVETGIDARRLTSFENGHLEPSGDEILILADCFQIPFPFFISGDVKSPIEECEILYRMHGSSFSREDRREVQEFLYLCESEHLLQAMLDKGTAEGFSVNVPDVSTYNGEMKEATNQGVKVANTTIEYLGLPPTNVAADVFSLLRRLGIHVFRRHLGKSDISGLFILHPAIGPCVLVNYSQDIFRQRFTAAHEAGHAIMDTSKKVVVSLLSEKNKLIERRANAFAARFLLPTGAIRCLPSPHSWDRDALKEWSMKLQVNPQTLALRLSEEKLISYQKAKYLWDNNRIEKPKKIDPELLRVQSSVEHDRLNMAFSKGLSRYYVGLCLEAKTKGLISSSRLAELLLSDIWETEQIATLFGMVIS